MELDGLGCMNICSISALCVMNHAMQDVRAYFERNVRSSAELCFLIRNIDVIITGILDINNILLGIGLNKSEKAIERCFTDKAIICKFRTLRSLILAHPVDTHYVNDRGESETIYLEDITPFNPKFDGFLVKEKCDYVKRMCKPESDESYFEPLYIEKDIVPVINTIIDSIEQLAKNVEQQAKLLETKLSQNALCLDKSSIQNYIISLDKELEKRYPSAVENVTYTNGNTSHYSIVYQCLMYFNAHFVKETQEKYDVFLEFGNDTPSNALWGIRCFRLLMPCINELIPVDVSVSDKELYCQYVAAEYLSNIS